MFKSKLSPLCLASLTLSLTACSGTEEIIEDIVETLTKKEQYIHGVAIDGYLSNAKVCLDVNGDMKCTAADGAIAVTNVHGQYKLALGDNTLDNKQILVQAIAGKTIDMDRPNKPIAESFSYTSPAKDNAIVSPMTSIMSAIAAHKNISQAQAEQEVATVLGIAADKLKQDFIADNTAESKQVHALAQALTRLMQQLNKFSELDGNKALFYKLLANIGLADLKAITDKPLQSGSTDASILEALNNEAAIAINSFIADFIASTVQKGDITPVISEELQTAYDEFNQLVNSTNSDLANLPKLQQAYTDSLNAYSTSINEYRQCLAQLCGDLVTKQQAVVTAVNEVKTKIADIQAAIAGIKEKINRINLNYAPLVSDLTKAGDLEKVRALLNLRLGVMSNFTSTVGEEPPELPGDGSGTSTGDGSGTGTGDGSGTGTGGGSGTGTGDDSGAGDGSGTGTGDNGDVTPPVTPPDADSSLVKNYDKNIVLRGVRVTTEWMPYSSTDGWTQAVPKGYKESESLKYYEFAIWEETKSIHLYAFDNDFDAGYGRTHTPEQSIAYREGYSVMKFDGLPPESDWKARSTFLKNSLTEFANYMVSLHPDAGHHLMYSGHGAPGGGLIELQIQPDDAGAFLESWSSMLGRNLGVVDMGGPCNKGGYEDVRSFCRYADYYVASDLSNGGYTFDEFTSAKYKETSQEIQYHKFFKESKTLREVLKGSLDTRYKRYEYSRNNMVTNKVEQASYIYDCKAVPSFTAAFEEFVADNTDYTISTDMLSYLKSHNAPQEVIDAYHNVIDYKIDNRSFFPWEVEANGMLMLYPSNL